MKRFLLLCALGSVALCGSNAYSQSRDLGAQRLILDDGAAGRLTISYAGPGLGTLVIPDGGGSLSPIGSTPNSTLAWNGSAWVENLNLLADPVTGGITVNGGIDNTDDGITNAGAISGATTFSAVPGPNNSFTVASGMTSITGRDVGGADMPFVITADLTGLTYGSGMGNTQGRMIRLAQTAHYYDLGIDQSGDLFISHNDATRVTFPTATGTVALTSDIGNGAMGGDLTGTVSNAQIATGAIINADVSNIAAIAGTKISPNFGTQNITTTGSINSGTGYFQNNSHALSLQGTGNTRVGIGSGGNLSSGQYNTTLGFQAGRILGTGSGNTYLGTSTADANFAGNMNVMIGRESGYASQGSNNSFVGVYSGYWNLGANNTFLGYYSGFANTGGTQNTYVGFYSGGDPNISNASALGNGAMATANNQIMLGNASVTQVTTTGTINSGAGYTVAGAAPAGQFLRGNGTRFVASAITAADLPAGSGNYINNSTTPQAASFNVTGSGAIGDGNDNITLNAGSGDFSLASSGLDINTTGDINDATSLTFKADPGGNPRIISALSTAGGQGTGIEVVGSLGNGSNNGGSTFLRGGVSFDGSGGTAGLIGGQSATGMGGSAQMTGGFSTSGVGGVAMVMGGPSFSNTGGSVSIQGGFSLSTVGGSIYLEGGSGPGGRGSINIGSASDVLIGGGTTLFALNTSNIDISASGEITGATGVTSTTAKLDELKVGAGPDKFAGVISTDDAAADGIEDVSNSLITPNSVVVVTANAWLGIGNFIAHVERGFGTMQIVFSGPMLDNTPVSYVIVNP